jgi:hypothetical protein
MIAIPNPKKNHVNSATNVGSKRLDHRKIVHGHSWHSWHLALGVFAQPQPVTRALEELQDTQSWK